MSKIIYQSKEPVIVDGAIPNIATRITKAPAEEGGHLCLERIEAMYTTYWASAGEISQFFIEIVKNKRIIGARCPSCKMVICPPYMTRCPSCQNPDKSFVELETNIEMPQVGRMLNTPPITVFANARFARYAPFGRGRVMLGESQSALPIQVFTTTGFLKPDIFKAGTKVKIVFRKNRVGFSTDYFAVPLSEVPPKLRNKKGLEEHELKWASLKLSEPVLKDEYKAKMKDALAALKKFLSGIKKSPRAQRDLINWSRKILVKTGGGSLGLIIANQDMKLVEKKSVAKPNLVIVIDDPQYLINWTKGDSIINLIRTDKAAVSNLQDLETIFKLDRLHRSMRRDAQEKGLGK